jgi:hypothetical protein
MGINESKERRYASIVEVIGIGILIIGSILMFWKTTDIRLSALEIRMNEKEKTDQAISDKLDKLQDGINDVRLTLKDKQDRKQ